MKFLFVLVFCFCSLFGRTFDDVVDEKHEKLMLEVYKGQEHRYYNIKKELDKRIAAYPKEALSLRNCAVKIMQKGHLNVPAECNPSRMIDYMIVIFSRKVFTTTEVDHIFASKVFLEMKMRGVKVKEVNEWISFFRNHPTLHRNWVKACRANCGLSMKEQEVKKLREIEEITVTPSTYDKRK